MEGTENFPLGVPSGSKVSWVLSIWFGLSNWQEFGNSSLLYFRCAVKDSSLGLKGGLG